MEFSVTVIPNLAKPMGVHIDPSGNLYVAEFGNHRVLKYDPDLNLVGKILEQYVDGPHCITNDKDGFIYVTDYRQNRIQKFDPELKFVQTFLSITKVPEPWMLGGVCCAKFGPDGYFYTVNFLSDCISRFSPSGEFLGWLGADLNGQMSEWKTSGRPQPGIMQGGFRRPSSLCFDDKGHLFVAGAQNHRIQKITMEGRPVGWIGLDRTNLTNMKSFTFRDTESEASQIPGGFDTPMSVEFDSSARNILVTEFGNHRIQRFTEDGVFLGWFGGMHHGICTNDWSPQPVASYEGDEIGCFSRPYDAKVFKNRMIVADTYNMRIQIIRLPAWH